MGHKQVCKEGGSHGLRNRIIRTQAPSKPATPLWKAKNKGLWKPVELTEKEKIKKIPDA